MFYKNKWLIFLNIFLLLINFIIVGVYYNNIPVKIIFTEPQNISFKLNSKTFNVIGAKKTKVFLPANTKDIKFYFKTDKITFDSIKISKYVFGSNELNSSLSLHNYQTKPLETGDIELVQTGANAYFSLNSVPEIIKIRQKK